MLMLLSTALAIEVQEQKEREAAREPPAIPEKVPEKVLEKVPETEVVEEPPQDLAQKDQQQQKGTSNCFL
jgi:hypothetical protein